VSSRAKSKPADLRELPAYSIAEIAHHLGVPPATIRYWATGQGPYPALIEVPRVPKGEPTLLSFLNLVELHVLAAIRRKHAVPMPKVRSAIEYLSRHTRSKADKRHPLISRDAGHLVEIHDDHLPIDAPDEDWIRLSSKNGWVAVTKDKNIRYRRAELAAVVEYEARVIVIRAKNTTGAEIADILVKFHARMQDFVNRTPAPFVAGIDRSGKISKYEH